MKNRAIKFNTLLFIIIVAIQSTWYILIMARQIATPSILKNVDYIAIYPAGYIAHYEGISNTYDLNLQQRVEAAVIYPAALTQFYPYNHPPFLLRILQWVTTKNYTASFYRWIFVLVVFHLTDLILLALLLRSSGWQRKEVWLVAISGFLFYPIFAAYLKGQDSAFTLLGVALCTYGLLTKKDKLAGLGLVLAVMRPQIALVLALPFLFRRQKVWWWFVCWGLIMLLYFYLLIGAQGLNDFIRTLFFSAEGMGLDVKAMPTLMGAIVRIFPTISAQMLHAIGYGAYGLVILFLCFVWLKSREIRFNHFGLAVLISVVFSPHLHVHDLSLLIIPAVGAMVNLVEKTMLSRRNAVFLLLCVSVVFTINGVFFSYLTIYLMIFLLGLFLWVPGWPKVPEGEKSEC
jgi:hypothetical protein